MPLLSLKNLFKTYRSKKAEIKAINGLSLDIYEGEFLIIMGASGSGKSSLLNLIAGLDTPTSGEIFYKDVNIETLPERQKALYRQKIIGIVFQRYNLVRKLSALFNIQLGAFISTGKQKHVNFDALRFVIDLDIEKKKNQPVERLSQGQQQRVAIARALMTQSDIILADEPTGNLDRQNSDVVLALFQKINKDLKKTVILVTHNSNLTKAADRVIYMKDGQIDKEEIINDKSKVIASPGNMLKDEQTKTLPFSSLLVLTSKILFSDKRALFGTLAAVILGVGVLTVLVLSTLINLDASIPSFLESVVAKNQVIISAESEGFIYNVVSSVPFEHITAGRTLSDATLSSVKSMPHVSDVYPVVPLYVTSPYFSNYTQTGEPVKDYSSSQHILKEGSYFTSDTQKAIIITQDIEAGIEQQTGVKSVIGMTIPIKVTLDQYSSPRSITVTEDAEIIGVNEQLFELDPPLVPANFDHLISSHALPSYSFMDVDLDSANNVQNMVQTLSTQGYSTYTYGFYRSMVNKLVVVQNIFIGLIGILAIISIILGLINIISVSISGRVKTMEIFMALGIQKNDLRKYIILESVILGVVTGILGSGLGFGISYAIEKLFVYFIISPLQLYYYHSFDFYPITIPFIILAAVIICFIDACYIAFKISSSETLVSLLKRE